MQGSPEEEQQVSRPEYWASAKFRLLLARRHIGTDAMRHFSRRADRFAEGRVRMDALADIDRIATHLGRQAR